MSKLQRGAKSPSSHMTVTQLAAIRADQYRGASGQDYSAEEVDALYWRKLQRKADSTPISFIDAPQSGPKKKANKRVRTITPPRAPIGALRLLINPADRPAYYCDQRGIL